MLLKTLTAGLTAATLIAGVAAVPTIAAAAGRGAAGNWPQSGTWNWPEYAGPVCHDEQVKVHDAHGRPYWRWVRRCP